MNNVSTGIRGDWIWDEILCRPRHLFWTQLPGSSGAKSYEKLLDAIVVIVTVCKMKQVNACSKTHNGSVSFLSNEL